MTIQVAIIGATGAVGKEILKLLEQRAFPAHRVRCFASPRSAGSFLLFKGENIAVETLSDDCFHSIDLAFFCAGKRISREWVPQAIAKGVRVIDSSSFFRMHKEVPLVIPEINAHAMLPEHRLIASPNCSASIMLMALYPLHKRYRLKRVFAATYQAASGAGALAMKELEEETLAHLEKRSYQRTVIPFPYAFNLFPHNSPLLENGYVEEEVKMQEEAAKILEDDSIKVNAMCVRVPILRAHSEALNVTFEEAVDIEEAYRLLNSFPGLKVMEERSMNRFPMPIDASGCDEVLCGRLRLDPTLPNTIDLWVVGDQLLKGAALNAVQIAEQMRTHHALSKH
jgi:aspartate-semialdehyde dehydrogenase